jgi:hypothetical protein
MLWSSQPIGFVGAVAKERIYPHPSNRSSFPRRPQGYRINGSDQGTHAPCLAASVAVFRLIATSRHKEKGKRA